MRIFRYDYCPIAAIYPFTGEKEQKYANVFTMDKVGFMTGDPGTEVSYTTHKLKNGYDSPEDGELVAQDKGTYTFSGYHRFTLSDKAEPGKGESISVAAENAYKLPSSPDPRDVNGK